MTTISRLRQAILAGALALLAPFAGAQQPVQGRAVPAAFRDFAGGVNDADDPAKIAPNESPDLLNVTIDEKSGSFAPRRGFIQCGVTPSGSKATVLYEYARASGARRLLLSDNTNVWETPDCVTFSTVTTALGGSNIPTITTARDKAWILNRSTHAITWDGTTGKLLDGTAGTPSPAPPRGAYDEFWRERVWIARTSADPSILQWSALTDSNGTDLDPSTGTLSWPATNAVYVDRDGGSPIYAIKAYRDNLFVFKNNGIWRISFQNDFDIAVVKTLSSVGTRYGTSVSELDGLLYFIGPDGAYAFDGDQSTRLSDKWVNKFGTLRQQFGSDQQNTWTTKTEFDAGTHSSTTATSDGTVQISSYTVLLTNGDFETGALSPNVCYRSVTTDAGTNCNVNSVAPIAGTYSSSITATQVQEAYGSWGVKLISLAGSTMTTLSYPDLNTGTVSPYLWDVSAYQGTIAYLKFYADGGAAGGTVAALYTSTFTVQDKVTFKHTPSLFSHSPTVIGWKALDDIQSQQFFSSGVYTSQIYNAVTVSSWTTFETEDLSNSGSLQYQVKVGSNTGAVDSKAFSNITPGALIQGTTWQMQVQWRAILTAPSTPTASPLIYSVTLNWSQGELTSQPITGFAWKNRYWVSAASGTSTNNNLVMVKSRNRIAWVPNDLQIGSMSRYNDNFYAAASTHSAIYRMDYGTNDNGLGVPWYWTSRDEDWGAPNQKKRITEIGMDFQKGTAANGFLRYSCDGGSSYTSRTINMSGTGRGSTRQFVNVPLDYACRVRAGSSTADESADILGITPWAIVSPYRQ